MVWHGWDFFPHGTRIDFMRYKGLCLAASLVAMAVSSVVRTFWTDADMVFSLVYRVDWVARGRVVRLPYTTKSNHPISNVNGKMAIS